MWGKKQVGIMTLASGVSIREQGREPVREQMNTLGRGAGLALASLSLAFAAALPARAADAPQPAPVANASPVQAASPAPVWSRALTEGAEPAWPVAAVPAGISPVPLARLGELRAGMTLEGVNQLLGAPHGSVKSSDSGEVWQYVVRDPDPDRVFIASLWFNSKGLWLATGRSRPIGQLAALKFQSAPLELAVAGPASAVPPASPAPPDTAPPAATASAQAAPALPAAPAAAAPVPATPSAMAPPTASASVQPAPAPSAVASAAPSAMAPPTATASVQPAPAAPAASAASSANPPAAPVASAPPAAPAPAPAALPAPGAATVAPPVPVVAAPSPKPDEAPALREALAAWLDDWRKQNVDAYLSHYAPDYAPAGKKREVWEKERRERLATPSSIAVDAQEVELRATESARPKIAFVQSYKSDRYEEKSRKVLTFVKRNGRWLIAREENAPLPR